MFRGLSQGYGGGGPAHGGGGIDPHPHDGGARACGGGPHTAQWGGGGDGVNLVAWGKLPHPDGIVLGRSGTRLVIIVGIAAEVAARERTTAG